MFYDMWKPEIVDAGPNLAAAAIESVAKKRRADKLVLIAKEKYDPIVKLLREKPYKSSTFVIACPVIVKKGWILSLLTIWRKNL